MYRTLLACLTVVVLAGCATPAAPVRAGVACTTRSFSVVDDFVAARRGSCTALSNRSVRLEIRSEDERVTNPSPWFAFKLIPAQAGEAVVVLDYDTWTHRYRPKVSNDGVDWRPLAEDRVRPLKDGTGVELHVALDEGPIWVAAQAIVDPDDYDEWVRQLTATTAARASDLGKSFGGRPIVMLDHATDSRDLVLLTGRQHPPEVSGAWAFFAFSEIVFADTELARRFRERFHVVAIPLLNPDGVVAGHWRHSFGAVDLNRDWGPFTQPETRLVADLLDRVDRDGGKVRAFIDFHSTDRNLFYTQVDEEATDPPGFTSRWLEDARGQLSGYAFTNEQKPTSDQPNGKNYFYKRYGIPSMTYEVGDETDRETTMAAARVFAETFMRHLLGETG